MKRILLAVGISFFVATRLAFYFTMLSALLMSLGFVLTAFLFFFLRHRWKRAHSCCVVFLTFALAFTGYALHLNRNVLPQKKLAGQTATISGIITDMDSGIKSTSYNMTVTFDHYPDIKRNVPVILRSIAEFDYSPGDIISCEVKLVAAPDTIWYKSRGIYLLAQNPGDVKVLPSDGYRYRRALLRLRDMLTGNVYSRLSPESADIISVMVLGAKNNISPQIYAAVGRSGTSHLLSISGLHLSILSAFVLWILNRVKCPRRLAAFIAIFISFLFVAFVGFGASVSRSFIMTALMLFGRILSRRSDSLTSLGLALIICCGISPYWALSWGLWLSAGSTLGIILYGTKLSDKLFERFKRGISPVDKFVRFVTGAFAISIAAYAFTLPILLLMSGWISLVSPLANMLIAPFVPVSILGGIICAAPVKTTVFVKLAAILTNFSVRVIVGISQVLSDLPFAVAAISETYLLVWLIVITVFLAAIIYARKTGKNYKKFAAYLAAFAVLFYSAGGLAHTYINRGKVELVTFSSRHAALLIRRGEAVVLGAPDPYEISNLQRYLSFRGIKNIPAVIAADCGDRISSGMLRLGESYKLSCIVGPEDEFILRQIEYAMPESKVFAGGYAVTSALGGVLIKTNATDDNIHIYLGNNQIVKLSEEYDIINAGESNDIIMVFDDGEVSLPPGYSFSFEPCGAYLFGENRLKLSI